MTSESEYKIGVFIDGRFFYNVFVYWMHYHPSPRRLIFDGVLDAVRWYASETVNQPIDQIIIHEGHYFHNERYSITDGLIGQLGRCGIVFHSVPCDSTPAKRPVGLPVDLALTCWDADDLDMVMLISDDESYRPLAERLVADDVRVLVPTIDVHYLDQRDQKPRDITTAPKLCEAASDTPSWDDVIGATLQDAYPFTRFPDAPPPGVHEKKASISVGTRRAGIDDNLDSFTVVWANLHYGGINPSTGDDASWRETMEAIAPLRPDVVCLQEIDHRPTQIWAHLWRTANFLSMQPVLGPSAATRTLTGNHVGFLVRTRPGMQIVNQWPPPGVAGPQVPWCKVSISIAGLSEFLHVYCVHLPARSTSAQMEHLEFITNLITRANELAIVAGDFNGYPADPMVTPSELATIAPHLQLTRCMPSPDGLVPSLRAWQELKRAGLLDVVATLPAELRDPGELIPTGRGGARVDRCHAVERLTQAATRYQQIKTGSDHDAGALWFDLKALAA